MKILFRPGLAESDELKAAQGYCDVIESRTQVQKGDLVIGRYSVLPFYKELEQDLDNQGANLVNSHRQHLFMADIEEWYSVLSDYTPHTYFSLAEAMDDDYQGPYVLKGHTNSRKHLWRTHMFANNKDDMRNVYFRLQDDGLVGPQGIVIRKYEKLRNFGFDISGMPITNEHRYFVLGNKIVDSGYYWANHPETYDEAKKIAGPNPQVLADKIVSSCKGRANFYSFDLAQKSNGDWILIELNDGQMAGLSCIDPDKFYNNLAQISRDMAC